MFIDYRVFSLPFLAVLAFSQTGVPFVQSSFTPANLPDFLFPADVNRDGKLDIVFYSEETSDGPVVFLGNGHGALSFFGKGPAIPFSPYIAVGDVDGDGIPDVVIAQQYSARQSLGGITVLHGNGDGTFTPAYQYQFPSSDETSAGGVAIADVNRDGNADIIVTDTFNGVIYVFLGLGGGNFQLSSFPAASLGPGQVVTGDFDGDGNLDLAIAIALGSSSVTQPPYSAVSFMFGAGDGTFPSTVTLQFPGLFPYSIAAADFDVDGAADLAVTGLYGGSADDLGIDNAATRGGALARVWEPACWLWISMAMVFRTC